MPVKEIKLLHTGDIHIGMENYGRVDPTTGLNARVMDFLRRLSDMADYAIEQEVDVFVFAGDAYKTRDPNPTYQREFARRIKRIADAGIPVVLLVGNHDLPNVARRATSISIFDTLAVPNIVRVRPGGAAPDHLPARATAAGRGRALPAALGGGQPRRVAGQEPARSWTRLLQNAMIDMIQGLAAQAAEHPEVPAILVGHFSVNEASQGSEQNIMIGRDVAVPRSVLIEPVWRYVALGHIHKHQSLNRDEQPPVIYSGSIERIDFGEEHEPKGFVVAAIGDGPTSWEFVHGYRRQARRFVTIRVDVREATDPTAEVVKAIQARGDLSEAVVRVIVRLNQEQEPLLVEREIAVRLRALTSRPRCKKTSCAASASGWAVSRSRS